jgi:hypothetical protein
VPENIDHVLQPPLSAAIASTEWPVCPFRLASGPKQENKASRNWQKFFGSFFQKRTALFCHNEGAQLP